MIELPFVFFAGLLGTAHCLGMCGPLILSIASGASSWNNVLARQLVYSLGRIFSYSVLGMVAGYVGARLAGYSSSLINIPATLAILAGVLFCYQGLKAAGVFSLAPKIFSGLLEKRIRNSSRATKHQVNHDCGVAGLFAPYFRGRDLRGVMVAGVLTGFLPCGLLYGMLAMAASTHHLLWGGAIMLTFGLGTMPLLVLAGVGGHFMTMSCRRWLYSAAAWCLIATGVISVVRGASHLSFHGKPAAGCPMCAKK